ncbi:TPM domain-containing protein [Yoonia sp. BS5-3]|uniref:YgcG family protein n=1 Tax=Yoonia phaeophyticola TaxID=3137369 RepID=A0ABZ2V5Z2_9RHOB
MLLLLSLGTAFAQSYPADVDHYINDYANLLNDTEEDSLRATLDELYQETDIEFTVLTIPRMSQYGHDGSIETFATGLFNTWGIGDADRNDGLLLLVSRFDRELRIEVGAGYGDQLNGAMQYVIDKKIVPHFRVDDYPAGIEAGVTEIIYEVTGR